LVAIARIRICSRSRMSVRAATSTCCSGLGFNARGKATDARAKLAFFQMGEQLSLELIEPIGGPSTWQEFLDTHGEGVHHIAFRVKGTDSILAQLESKGLTTVQTGDHTGGRYAYVDAMDTLKIFLELLAAREHGVRLTMLVPEEKGMLASVTNEIAAMGGNILALSTFMGEDPTNRMVTVKVTDVATEKLVAIMEALGMEIVDVRED